MRNSKQSKKSSSTREHREKKTDKPRDLRKAITVSVQKRAKAIADQYTVILAPHPQLGFTGSSLEFPTVFTHAKTAAACVKKTREALMVGVAVMLEADQTPPVAASENARNQQVNIRLTAKEKVLLESAAKRHGFRGLSDFMRSAALSHIRKSA